MSELKPMSMVSGKVGNTLTTIFTAQEMVRLESITFVNTAGAGQDITTYFRRAGGDSAGADDILIDKPARSIAAGDVFVNETIFTLKPGDMILAIVGSYASDIHFTINGSVISNN